MSSASDPAAGAATVTLDADISTVNGSQVRGIYVGAAGNVAVRTSLGEEVTFVGLQAGSIIPVRVRRVLTSGTTVSAGNLLALY